MHTKHALARLSGQHNYEQTRANALGMVVAFQFIRQ